MIYPVIQTIPNQFGLESVHMIINLPTKRIRARSHANNYQCFVYKMAAETS